MMVLLSLVYFHGVSIINANRNRHNHILPHRQPHLVYMFDKFQLTFNFKSKVSRDVFKNKMNVNWHLHFLLKYHLNVTCLIVCVISNSKVSIDVWLFFFFTSHTTCQILNRACQATCILFFCKFLRAKCQKLAKPLSIVHIDPTTLRLG